MSLDATFLFLFFLYFVYSDDVGDDFIDEFRHPSEIWTQKFGGLVCLQVDVKTKAKNKCMWKTDENMKYVTVHSKKTLRSEVNLYFRNDCSGVHCCDTKSDYCTQMSAGQLTSEKMYSYGTFKWQARTVGVEDTLDCAPEPWCYDKPTKVNNCDQWAFAGECQTNMHYMRSCCKPNCGCHLPEKIFADVVTCFILENSVKGGINPSGTVTTALGFCIPSRSPNSANVIWQFRGKTYHQQYALNFNSARRTTMFRIDWHPNNVRWYVNGLKMHEIKEKNFQIPDENLYLKTFVMPVHRPHWVDSSEEKVDIFARVFKVQYKALFPITTMQSTTTSTTAMQVFGRAEWWKDPNGDHTELLVSGKLLSTRAKFVCFTSLLSVACLIAFLFIRKHFIPTRSIRNIQGDYVLMHDDSKGSRGSVRNI